MTALNFSQYIYLYINFTYIYSILKEAKYLNRDLMLNHIDNMY